MMGFFLFLLLRGCEVINTPYDSVIAMFFAVTSLLTFVAGQVLHD